MHCRPASRRPVGRRGLPSSWGLVLHQVSHVPNVVLEENCLTSFVLLDIEASQECNGVITSPAAFDLESTLDIPSIPAARRERSPQDLSAARKSGRRGLRVGTRRLSVLGDRLRVGVNAEDASSAAKLVVDGAEVDLLDAHLAQEGSTHDARLDGDVQGALADDLGVDNLVGVLLHAIRVEMALASIFVALVRLAGDGRCVVVRFGFKLGLEARRSRTRLGRDGDERGKGHELGVSSTVSGDVGGVHASGDDLVLVDEDAADRCLVGSESEACLNRISEHWHITR